MLRLLSETMIAKANALTRAKTVHLLDVVVTLFISYLEDSLNLIRVDKIRYVPENIKYIYNIDGAYQRKAIDKNENYTTIISYLWYINGKKIIQKIDPSISGDQEFLDKLYVQMKNKVIKYLEKEEAGKNIISAFSLSTIFKSYNPTSEELEGLDKKEADNLYDESFLKSYWLLKKIFERMYFYIKRSILEEKSLQYILNDNNSFDFVLKDVSVSLFLSYRSDSDFKKYKVVGNNVFDNELGINKKYDLDLKYKSIISYLWHIYGNNISDYINNNKLVLKDASKNKVSLDITSQIFEEVNKIIIGDIEKESLMAYNTNIFSISNIVKLFNPTTNELKFLATDRDTMIKNNFNSCMLIFKEIFIRKYIHIRNQVVSTNYLIENLNNFLYNDSIMYIPDDDFDYFKTIKKVSGITGKNIKYVISKNNRGGFKIRSMFDKNNKLLNSKKLLFPKSWQNKSLEELNELTNVRSWVYLNKLGTLAVFNDSKEALKVAVDLTNGLYDGM